jgi:phenylpropionate dioxygenase-like ring-hydroxylating dioxygenase large terminal subunit
MDHRFVANGQTTLADGTRIEDLVDVETREVAMRVLSDPELYELEMERVFAKSWILLAHDTEIPNPGDFVTRDLGADPVIVSRAKDGAVKVFLNVCMHRGMIVCRSECGNTSQFKCIYHGWTYDDQGRFLGSPVAKEQMHGDIYPKSQLGLREARVETFGGFVFATWDEKAPSLDEYLGEMKFYLELLFDKSEGGLESVGPPQRYVIHSNWKCAGEQFAGDGYHTLMLHRSLLELGVIGGDGESIAEMAPAMYGVDVSSPQGHGLRCIPATETFAILLGRSTEGLSTTDKLKALPPVGFTPDMVDTLSDRFGEDQLQLLADAPPTVGGMFPNVGIVFVYSPAPDGTMLSTISMHTFVPKGPDKFEFLNWCLVERDAPEELKRKMTKATVQTLGSSGTIEQDDADTWPEMQRAATGPMGRRQTLKYQALLGENKPDDWPGGGLVYNGFSKDDNQWNWWLRWRDLMLNKAW